MSNSFDVIVLGSGPAGYVAAIRAAQLGLATAVIERDKLGGVCVNIGCIPTKALLASASLVMAVRDAGEFGVSVDGVKTDYRVAMTRSRRVSDQNSRGVEFLMKKNKITVVKGTGVLRPGRRVQVASDTLEARRAVILATGSRVKGIPQIGLEINGTSVLSSDDALFLDHVPPSLAIIGAGAVGMEFADIFNAFGTRVTLIEALPRLLPLEDAESSEALTRSYRKRKIEILTGASVTRATVGAEAVTLEVATAGNAARTVEVKAVLVAAGRAPNTEALGLAEVGVQLTERGFIKVDQYLETTAPGIYAIGDVAGPPMLAHKGSREGVNAVERIAGLEPHPIRYDNVPSVTYCRPEVASIGLTEEQAKERGLAYSVGRFPFSANARARCTGETEGFVKILRDTKYGEILGAHIVGSRRLRANSRTRRGAGERVHGRRGGARDPCPSDARRGRGGSRARLARTRGALVKDPLAIGLGALGCGTGLGGGTIVAGLVIVRTLERRVAAVTYEGSAADPVPGGHACRPRGRGRVRLAPQSRLGQRVATGRHRCDVGRRRRPRRVCRVASRPLVRLRNADRVGGRGSGPRRSGKCVGRPWGAR